MGSAAVSWWSVHEWVQPYLQPYLDAAGPLPMVGTPEWCALDDADPRKVAALFDAAQHWALRIETGQTALAEASRDISASTEWASVATEIFWRRSAYIPREVA
ncbi:MAG TPA: DUF2742 domain-containing protein [Mycobacterium sp.]|jgi:hypothetical protein|nr:DUF2742 domain-containing protein [Mycobacterium sp.]